MRSVAPDRVSSPLAGLPPLTLSVAAPQPASPPSPARRRRGRARLCLERRRPSDTRPICSPGLIPRLALPIQVVDGFSLMTYDFTPSHARDGVALSPPNSPLPWVRECLDKLLEWPASIFQKPEGVEAKVLMGLNFYGYRYLLQVC